MHAGGRNWRKWRSGWFLLAGLGASALVHAIFLFFLSHRSSVEPLSQKEGKNILLELEEVYAAKPDTVRSPPPPMPLSSEVLVKITADSKRTVPLPQQPPIEIDVPIIDSDARKLYMDKAASISEAPLEAPMEIPLSLPFPPMRTQNSDPMTSPEAPFFMLQESAAQKSAWEPENWNGEEFLSIAQGNFFPSFQPQKTSAIRDYGLSSEIALAVQPAPLEIYAAAREDQKKGGYFFSIELKMPLASSEGFPQNFLFVLDKASTIDGHRFETYKKSVLRALKYLPQGQNFNIYIIGSKSVALSPTPLAVNAKTLSFAESFLEKQQSKLPFLANDLSIEIEKMAFPSEEKNTLNTIIVLTNGKTSLGEKKRWQKIDHFLNKHPSFRIYPVAAGEGNDLLFLDYFASKAGGRLVYSETHAALPRKLAKLLMNLRTPLVQDVQWYAKPLDSETEIEFISSSQKTAVLYRDEPYILYGKTNRLAPFNLKVEGFGQEGILSAQATVTPVERSSPKIQKPDLKIALKGTHLLYDKFLAQGDKKSLRKALLEVESFGKKAFE